jgi:aminoglycoside phosphotransferase (APT) family kinase protein
MPVTQDRGNGDLEEALAGWLGVTRVVTAGRPASGGWSNETIFVTADGADLVLRLAPAGRAMFPDYDLGRQVACLRHVRAHGLAAPEVTHCDLAGSVLGRPMFAMRRIPGRIPADGRPNFARAGWLHDSVDEEQRRFSESLVDALARLHRLPVPDFLDLGPHPATHLRWCDGLRPAHTRPDDLLDRVRDRLDADAPRPGGEAALVWGDARAANTIVDDAYGVCGLLDWELAGTGPPELDLAWMYEMDRMRAPGGRTPALPGFLTEQEVAARWQARTGKALDDDPWYRLYAAFKIVVLLELHLAAARADGGTTPDPGPRPDNRARRRLRKLLES